MKAIRIHQYGGGDVIRYEDAPIPYPAENEVLVRVHAAGVNPADWKIREGYLKTIAPLSFPATLGIDFSGTVEDLGKGVVNRKKGDEVFGCTGVFRPAAFAEYLTLPAAACAAKPASISHENAAAIPTAAMTAWSALFSADAINLTAGQTLLIHGGAGGVGSFAIQLAKAHGATVIATGSTGSLGFLRELGADVVIDYTQRRFEDVAHAVDGVLDTVGGETLARSWSVIKRGGALASIVQPPDSEEAKRYGLKGIMVMGNPESLPALADMIGSGRIKVIISRIWPLAEAGNALALSQTGHIRGKVVLRVPE